MEGKGNISDYRSKLARTLSSPNLTDDQKLQSLVRNQILQSSNLQSEGYNESVVETRTKEVSDFLDMLRSASLNDTVSSRSDEHVHSSWKVKQDTEEFRVMYRQETPFHTLLVEGYVDGPLDVCLCISWETSLYSKWWPQTVIPVFKIISSKCLHRVESGEQISIVRLKVPWPLSSREVVIHYSAFEYSEDDLIVVLLNSISDSEKIEIPNADEVVRIDLVGGVAFQKVAVGQSYFRMIVNLDVKLAYVPPSLINFISRQLLGSGFKLFKKEVASVIKGDEAFREALKDPFYSHVREAFDSIIDSEAMDVALRDTNEANEEEGPKEKDERSSETCSIDQILKRDSISPEVEQALETLEKAIFMFRINNVNSTNSEMEEVQDDQMSRNCSESSKIESEDLGFFRQYSYNNLKTTSLTANPETVNGKRMISTKKNKKFRFCC